MEKRTGVFICHCGINIAGYLDVDAVAKFAGGLDSVKVARHYIFMCSEPGQELIKQDIRELGLNRVVVASCSPTLHLHTFRRACESAGLNPFLCEMATIREFCSWVHSHDRAEATRVAKGLVAETVRKVGHNSPLQVRFAPVNPATLVLGAGVSGMQAAIEVASSKHKVYLVEKEPNIGGNVARLDKTFPDLIPAADILRPMMDSVTSTSHIELMTGSELVGMSGYIGNFEASIASKARYVDAGKCNGCGKCWEQCPVEVDNKFDLGLAKRKAIYIPYRGAAPEVPVLDREHCRRFTDGRCQLCQDACDSKAIDFTQSDTIKDVDVGAVIVAIGYDTFDPRPMTQYGYGRLPNVITSVECERLLSASGPTGGRVLLKNGSTPRSVAILHCVGSRDKNYHKYCSRICCMYGLKQAHLIKERTGADVSQMYIDMRCVGKGYEEFYERVSSEGVNLIRGKVAKVTDIAINGEEKGKLVVVAEDTLLDRTVRTPVDLVVLNIAVEPRADADKVARSLLLGRSGDGFFLERHIKLDPLSTMIDGVYLAGCCQSPKDIQDSIAQGAGAAAKVLALIARGKVQMEAATASVDEDVCAGCGYCEAVCAYTAIQIDPRRRVARVNEAACKGCGACAVNCPSKAIQIRNFSPRKLMDAIEAAAGEYAAVTG